MIPIDMILVLFIFLIFPGFPGFSRPGNWPIFPFPDRKLKNQEMCNSSCAKQILDLQNYEKSLYLGVNPQLGWILKIC